MNTYICIKILATNQLCPTYENNKNNEKYNKKEQSRRNPRNSMSPQCQSDGLNMVAPLLPYHRTELLL